MQVDEDTDVSACLPTAEFLSAEELVSIRKPAEETSQPAIGEKLYRYSDSSLDEKALKCSLEGYKKTLNKKRAGRISDLMPAEWNPELNVVTVSKLKGKFTQHMGSLVNGKQVLSPEEAVFLIENNCIEIMNGEMPMSTEEAFSVILKGRLAHERYQVYSHLSKLGYVVVTHQIKAGNAESAREMDKYQWKKKRQANEHVEGEPEKKRLTFSGVFSGESGIETSDAKENLARVSESEICTVYSAGVTDMPEANERKITKKTVDNVSDLENNGTASDKVIEDIQSDLDKINSTSVINNELESQLVNKNCEKSNEINSACDGKAAEESEKVTQLDRNDKSNGVDSQNFNALKENDILQNDLPLKNAENRDSLDSNSQSSRIVDVMDVDTDAEVSYNASELSRDNTSTFDANVNVTSQDSCISVNNDDNIEGTAKGDSNFDVLSMSYSSEEEDEEVLTIDGVSADNLIREEDDDVTLLEVTKKETKPLAVIDLLSDDDDDEETEAVNVDDDITVLDEYPSASTGRPTSFMEINAKKIKGCKKEEESPVVSHTSSKLIPPLTVDFPVLYKRDVICLPRPPLHLLPNHVKPAKEAYVVSLKSKTNDQPSFGGRVWNSYRDLQDYQRVRRQNRHQNNNPRSQNFSALTWNDRNSMNRERFRRPSFGPDQANSSGVISNSRNLIDTSPMNFNRNLYSVNSFQNNVPLPNSTSMNCEVTTNESMVTSNGQSSQSNNFSFSSGMPNNPLANSMMSSSNFMPGMQRNFGGMGNVTNQFMADIHRTCLSMASNMLSSMLTRNSLFPNPSLATYPSGPFPTSMPNGFNNSFMMPHSTNEYLNAHHQYYDETRGRLQRGRPFPCRYRNIGNKRSWSDVRSAVCGSESDSDIEEMPISPREILWENKDICPLVKPGVHYPVGSIFKFLQTTQKAKVTNMYCYSDKLLPTTSNLEISFDVYPPGFTYKKTCPQIPKYRIVVVRAMDPIPKYSDIALLQRKWNDGSTLLIAINDNGDISFQSFNSISLPLVIPHEG